MLRLLFKFPPFVYFIIAPALLGLGVVLFLGARDDDAQRARARSHAAPAPVAIEAYDRTRDHSDWNEATIVAQLDVASMSEVVESKRGNERSRTTYAMLYPASATSDKTPAPGVLIVERKVADDELMKLVVGKGEFGPVVKINGRIETDSYHDSKMKMGLERGAGVVPNALLIKPFMDGRDAELSKPGDAIPILAGFSILALIVGLYGYFRLRRQRASGDSVYAS